MIPRPTPCGTQGKMNLSETPCGNTNMECSVTQLPLRGSHFPMWRFHSSPVADTQNEFPHASTLEVCLPILITDFRW